ncbi:MAG TPA: aldehyde dehydrogenase family protein [Solirubrobacterales bacterium]|jgi:aldehyde dehydrogenase (NAD+)
METLQLFVDGGWRDAADGATYESQNPYSGEPWTRVPDAGAADVDAAVEAAERALAGPWGAASGFERARLLHRLADLIERDAAELAAAESRDNGKLLREMEGQMNYLPAWYRWFAGLADKLHGETIPSDRPNFFVYTRREPVGVVAAIVPWNSPLLLTALKLAPALAAGCTVVLKPSDSTPVTGLLFARLLEEAGFPAGVLNILTGQSPELGKALVSHPGVAKVAFTGSPQVGAAVAAAAGERLIPVLLELGGKSANIVFADANLEAAVNGVVAGVFAASGQTCVAGSRLLVERSVAAEVRDRVVERAQAIRLGDPLDPATEMGPLANDRQVETVSGFVERARGEGVEIATGGGVSPELGGRFFEPTVVTGVRPDQEIVREELFGPVLVVLEFDDDEEAVALANSTRFGLAAGVWTGSVGRAHRVAERLRAGSVFVNDYRLMAPNVPFGGFGMSGFGRENGIEAISEFTATKAVWIELDGNVRDPFKLG